METESNQDNFADGLEKFVWNNSQQEDPIHDAYDREYFDIGGGEMAVIIRPSPVGIDDDKPLDRLTMVKQELRNLKKWKQIESLAGYIPRVTKLVVDQQGQVIGYQIQVGDGARPLALVVGEKVDWEVIEAFENALESLKYIDTLHLPSSNALSFENLWQTPDGQLLIVLPETAPEGEWEEYRGEYKAQLSELHSLFTKSATSHKVLSQKPQAQDSVKIIRPSENFWKKQ